MARAKNKKCKVKTTTVKFPRNPDCKDSVPKKRGRLRSSKTQDVLDSAANGPASTAPAVTAPVIAIAPRRRPQNHGPIKERGNIPKKRGRPRSSQTQNVSDPTVNTIHQENRPKMRRGRKRKCENDNSNDMIIDSAQDAIPEKRARFQGISKRQEKQTEVQYINCDQLSESDGESQDHVEISKLTFFFCDDDNEEENLKLDPLNSSQNMENCDASVVKKLEVKEEEEEILDSTCMIISFEDKDQNNVSQVPGLGINENEISTSSATTNNMNEDHGNLLVAKSTATIHNVKEDLVNFQVENPSSSHTKNEGHWNFLVEKLATPTGNTIPVYVVLDQEGSLTTLSYIPNSSNVNFEEPGSHVAAATLGDAENKLPVGVSENGLPVWVPTSSNNEKPISTSYAVDESLVLPNSNITPEIEDPTIEAILHQYDTGVLHRSNSDQDKLDMYRGLRIGFSLYKTIQKKDPTILTLSACFSTEKLFIVLDTIKQMSEICEQDVSHESFIKSLSWFFRTAGTEVIKEATCKSKSVEEKNSKIRDISMFLEVLENNWKTISSMKNIHASKSVKKVINGNADFITNYDTRQSSENSSYDSSSNIFPERCMQNNTLPTQVSSLEVNEHELAEVCQEKEAHNDIFRRRNRELWQNHHNLNKNIDSTLSFEVDEEGSESVSYNQDSGRSTPEVGLDNPLTNVAENSSSSLIMICEENPCENEEKDQKEDNTAQNNTSCGKIYQYSMKKHNRLKSNSVSNKKSIKSSTSRISIKDLSTLRNRKEGTKDVSTQNKKYPVSKHLHKRNYCMFCKKLITNFRRHVSRMHSDIEAVQKCKALPKTKSSRIEKVKIFQELRLKGNSMYNKQVIKDSKLENLIPNRRFKKKGTIVMCWSCEDIFYKKTAHRHKCLKMSMSKTVDKSNDTQEGENIHSKRFSKYFEIETATEEKNGLKNDSIAHFLNTDRDSWMVLNDDALMISVINSYQRKHLKKNYKNLNQYILKTIHLGCNFFLELKEKDCSILQLSDCLAPCKREIVTDTIKKMCKFDEIEGKIGVISMPSRLLRFMHDVTSQALKDVIFNQPTNEEKKSELLESIVFFEDFLSKLDLVATSQKDTLEHPPLRDSSNEKKNDEIVCIVDKALPAFVKSIDRNVFSEINVIDADSTDNLKSQFSLASTSGLDVMSSKSCRNLVSKDSVDSRRCEPMNLPDQSFGSEISLTIEGNPVNTISPREITSSSIEPNCTSLKNESASENQCTSSGGSETVQLSVENLNQSRIGCSDVSKDVEYTNENSTSVIHSNLKRSRNINTEHWKKKAYCLYCKKVCTNLVRHYLVRHDNEEEVIHIKSLKKTDRKQYLGELLELRKRGNYIYDKKILQEIAQKGSTNPAKLLNLGWRKTRKSKLEDLVLCTFCKKICTRIYFARHLQICYSKKKHDLKEQNKEPDSESKSTEPSKNKLLDKEFFVNLSEIEAKGLESELADENLDHQDIVSAVNVVCSQELSSIERIKHDLPKKNKVRCTFTSRMKHIKSRQSYKQKQLSLANIERAKNFCLYCKKFVAKFTQHMLAVHKDKKPIIQYIALLKEKSEESKIKRLKIIRLLRHKSKNILLRKYFLINSSLKLSNRRPQKISKIPKTAIKEENILCEKEGSKTEAQIYNCKSYNGNVLFTSNRADIKNKSYVLAKYAIPVIPPVPTEFPPQASTKLREFIPRIKKDHASMTALKDTLLVATASRISKRVYNKSSDNGFHIVSHFIKDGGRLLLSAQSFDNTVTEFRDLLSSSKVNTVLEAAKEMCGLDEKTGHTKLINMPFRITYVINQTAAQVLEETMNNASLNENDKKLFKEDIDKFLDLKRTTFRSIIVRWPGSKKVRKYSMSEESDEESIDENLTTNSTRTERCNINESPKVYASGSGLRVNKRKVYSSSESEENSCDESDGDYYNPKKERKRLGKLNETLQDEHLSFIRKKWTETQKRIVILEFKDFIMNGTNPGRKRCRELIASSEELSGRTADQVNLIIDNINKGKLKIPPEFEYLKRHDKK